MATVAIRRAPGVTAQSIDSMVPLVIKAAGYGEHFIQRADHGIGLDVHEPPYLVEADSTVLEEGMTFSVEPGIYIPVEGGIRIEEIVAGTTYGGESLNEADRTLREP